MAKGGGITRQLVILMVREAPPPRPPCFDTQAIWVDWLESAHLSGLRITRRVDLGKSQGERQTFHRLLQTDQIPYCNSCTTAHRMSMKAAQRCFPSAAHSEKRQGEPPQEAK